jgi:hypothetical protein
MSYRFSTSEEQISCGTFDILYVCSIKRAGILQLLYGTSQK